MNNTMIAGHLGADPEVRYTPDGQKVTNLRIATNIRKKGQDKTIWWNVTIWGDRFDRLLPYLKKGSAVMIWGEMGEPRIYNDKAGNPQVGLDLTAEIIRLSPFGRPDKQEQTPGGFGQANQTGYTAPGTPSQSKPQGTFPSSFPEGDFSYNPGASGASFSSGKSFDDDNVPF